MSTATWGRRWSSLRITVRPFGSLYFSNLISGLVARAANARVREQIAAILRMDASGACLSRAPRGSKARIRVFGILGDLFGEPGGTLEALPLVTELDLGQPEIALAEVIEGETAQLAAHLAQRAGAHPQEGLRVLVGDRVIEFRAGDLPFALDRELRMPGPVGPGDQPHPHCRLHAQVALLELVAFRELLREELLLHEKLPLDLQAHGHLFISRFESPDLLQPRLGGFDFLLNDHVPHRIFVPGDGNAQGSERVAETA